MVPSRLGSSSGMAAPCRDSDSSITCRQAPQGRRGAKIAPGGAGSHGHAHNERVAGLADGQTEQGRALGAQPAGVSGIFLVGAHENSAIGQQQGGPDQ